MRHTTQSARAKSPIKSTRQKRRDPRVETETHMPLKYCEGDFEHERRQPPTGHDPYRLRISPATRGIATTLPKAPSRPRRDDVIGNIEYTLDRMSHRLEELRIMLDSGLDDDTPRAA